MKIKIIEFGPETDSVIALYIDGELFEWGDWYHDKIGTWIDGFLAGLRFTDTYFELDSLSLPIDNEIAGDIVKLGDSPPEKWSDLPLGELE